MVLADLLRDGSGYSMYTPLMVLVSVALFLQIAVGILSLMVSNIKNQFNQFKGKRGMCDRILSAFRKDSGGEKSGGEDQDQTRVTIEDSLCYQRWDDSNDHDGLTPTTTSNKPWNDPTHARLQFFL